MKIAATGITSGVGRRLCEIAREAGHEVAGIVRDPERLDARVSVSYTHLTLPTICSV